MVIREKVENTMKTSPGKKFNDAL
jgi:hypothetical protein